VRIRLLTGLIVVALAGACITPSIPIPPPQPTAMTFSVNAADGTSTFFYAPDPHYPNAKVYVYNADLGEGIITTARPNGSVGPTAPFPAVIGNQVVVTFEMPEDSVSACVRVTEGTPTGLDVCF